MFMAAVAIRYYSSDECSSISAVNFCFPCPSRFKHMQIRVHAESAAFYRLVCTYRFEFVSNHRAGDHLLCFCSGRVRWNTCGPTEGCRCSYPLREAWWTKSYGFTVRTPELNWHSEDISNFSEIKCAIFLTIVTENIQWQRRKLISCILAKLAWNKLRSSFLLYYDVYLNDTASWTRTLQYFYK